MNRRSAVIAIFAPHFVIARAVAKKPEAIQKNKIDCHEADSNESTSRNDENIWIASVDSVESPCNDKIF